MHTRPHAAERARALFQHLHAPRDARARNRDAWLAAAATAAAAIAAGGGGGGGTTLPTSQARANFNYRAGA